MILYHNRYFKSEKLEDESIAITILEDPNKSNEVDMTGCILIHTKEGFIADKFTDKAIKTIETICKKSGEDVRKKQLVFRNRVLNMFISML